MIIGERVFLEEDLKNQPKNHLGTLQLGAGE